MNCKHCIVEGDTTKYYFCIARKRAISSLECKNCPLRINNMPKEFEEIFGKGFGR